MEHTLGALAALVGGELKGPPDLIIRGIASVEDATPTDITFITNKKYARLAATSRAAAFLVNREEAAALERPLIIVPHPNLAYAQVAALFAPAVRRRPGISPQAWLGEGVEMGAEVSIASLVCVGDRVKLGDRVTLMPGCVLGDDVEVGAGSVLYPNVTVMDRCRLGARVTVHSGAVIGADGFGFVPLPSGHQKIPQLGIVVIEDDADIGANVTIDRAALGVTRIGRGVKIDNLVMVAHNVVIGDHSILVAQSGVAGSTKLGKRVVLAAQAGLVGHIELGDGVQVGAQSGVSHSIPATQVVSGSPARPHKEFLSLSAHYSRLPDIYKRLKKLEQQVAKLTAGPDEEDEP